MTPAERIAAVADPGSVLELGAAARSQHPEVSELTPADGLHAALVRIGGSESLVLVEDPEALAVSDGEVARAKRHRALALAVARGRPIVAVIDGPPGGLARFEPLTGELNGRMADPRESVDPAIRNAPLVAVALGPPTGVLADLLGDADVIVGVGSGDVTVADAPAALECARRLLTVAAAPVTSRPGELSDEPMPAATAAGLLCDEGSLIVFDTVGAIGGGLGLVGGHPVVVLSADGPVGRPDLGAVRRRVALADRSGVPLVVVQDTPGLADAAAGDHDAMARLRATWRACRSPRIVVVAGDGHVLGDHVLGGRRLGIDFAIAWPWADLAVTDPAEHTVDALAPHRRGDPWLAAGTGLIDDVLTPTETAATLRRLVDLFAQAPAPAPQPPHLRVHQR